ncbi:MAG: hypothetical protein P8O09_03305 [Flavobacteriaceae bacterium]|nr:hypothetical protein [Flavobacteriaceae bacterium]
MFLISNTEYKIRLTIRGRKKKTEKKSNKNARQIQRLASKIFLVIFVLLFKLTILRRNRRTQRFDINLEGVCKTCGKTTINKQKKRAAKLLLCVKLFLVTIKTRVKREAIKARKYENSFKQLNTLLAKFRSKILLYINNNVSAIEKII